MAESISNDVVTCAAAQPSPDATTKEFECAKSREDNNRKCHSYIYTPVDNINCVIVSVADCRGISFGCCVLCVVEFTVDESLNDFSNPLCQKQQ